MCIVGKMAQDVGMVEVLWCHLHLVWLIFDSSILTCVRFHSENFLCLVLAVFFVSFVF